MVRGVDRRTISNAIEITTFLRRPLFFFVSKRTRENARTKDNRIAPVDRFPSIIFVQAHKSCATAKTIHVVINIEGFVDRIAPGLMDYHYSALASGRATSVLVRQGRRDGERMCDVRHGSRDRFGVGEGESLDKNLEKNAF